MSTLQDIILDRNLISAQDLAPYREVSNFTLLTILNQQFQITETELYPLIQKAENIPFIPLSTLTIDPQFSETKLGKEIKNMQCIPIYENQTTIHIATNNPYQPALQQFTSNSNKKVALTLINQKEIATFFHTKTTSEKIGRAHV